jgi:hypothetical protein
VRAVLDGLARLDKTNSLEGGPTVPNARLCKALIDRITDRANIIETGTESYRFKRTLEKRKTKAPDSKT